MRKDGSSLLSIRQACKQWKGITDQKIDCNSTVVQLLINRDLNSLLHRSKKYSFAEGCIENHECYAELYYVGNYLLNSRLFSKSVCDPSERNVIVNWVKNVLNSFKYTQVEWGTSDKLMCYCLQIRNKKLHLRLTEAQQTAKETCEILQTQGVSAKIPSWWKVLVIEVYVGNTSNAACCVPKTWTEIVNFGVTLMERHKVEANNMFQLFLMSMMFGSNYDGHSLAMCMCLSYGLKHGLITKEQTRQWSSRG